MTGFYHDHLSRRRIGSAAPDSLMVPLGVRLSRRASEECYDVDAVLGCIRTAPDIGTFELDFSHYDPSAGRVTRHHFEAVRNLAREDGYSIGRINQSTGLSPRDRQYLASLRDEIDRLIGPRP
jgi:hypothetical protein